MLSILRRKSCSHNVLKTITRLTIIFTAVLLSLPVSATTIQQKSFTSPEKAVQALIDSLKKDDMAALKAIFGPDSEKLLSSGDPVDDRQVRERFLAYYEESQRLDKDGKNKAILVIGKIEWPFPIPLVSKNNQWQFNTKAGLEEILNRRIGRNELDTIQTCLAIIDAQREYAMNDYDGNGLHDYAAKFFSDPGKKNGLYWKTTENETPSPLGEMVVKAKAVGYADKKGAEGPTPYHGYFYRLLTGQGKNAAGGAYDYLIRDHLLGGVAVVAYPAEYGSSGVMTFIVNHDGVVYQKDLGDQTEQTANSMKLFDPGPGWTKVEVPEEQ